MQLINPMTGEIITRGDIDHYRNDRLMIYGLTQSQINIVKKSAPARTDLYDTTDCYTDLMALPFYATIINFAVMPEDEMDCLLEFYSGMKYIDKTIISTDYIALPASVKIKIIEDLEENADKLKYILLTAHTKRKKTTDFSKRLSNSILILDMIKKHPGIKTLELAEVMEMSERSIQRYIETLRLCGEWIEYDRKIKGWKLINNVSLLLNDEIN